MGKTHPVLDLLCDGMPCVLRTFLGGHAPGNTRQPVSPRVRRRIPGANGSLLDILEKESVVRLIELRQLVSAS